MQVSQAMTRDVRVADPSQSIQDAARIMAEIDVGALPVGENDRLVGMITDRDIAVRAIASGKGPHTQIREVMRHEVLYCYEDEEIDDVARNMGAIRVRRLPVVDRNKRLVGNCFAGVSLGDLANTRERQATVQAVSAVSRPDGPHSQTIQ